MWMAMDNKMLGECMKMILEIASPEDIQQPILLSHLNVLDLHLSSKDSCKTILHILGAESVETLIHLVTPKEVRFDFLDIPESQVEEEDLDVDTPPAHNLSRMDEKSICIQQEEEKIPRGLDNSVRLAAATVLARLGYCPLDTSEEGVRLLQSRICTAVNNFFTSFYRDSLSEYDDQIMPSMDLTKRLFRLQIAIASPENEDFVATMLYTTEVMRQQKSVQMKKDKVASEKRLEDAVKREKILQHEKEKLVQQQKSQSLVFQREMNRMQHNTVQDSRQLVAIHASERSQAEARASEFAKRVSQAESELALGESQVQESRAAETDAKESMTRASARVIELNQQVKELQRQYTDKEAQSSEIAEELEAHKQELNSFDRRQRELEEEIHQREDVITEVQGSNEKLQDDLEDLFADMVSFAQIYQSKEKLESSGRQATDNTIKKISDQLNAEKQRNTKLKEREQSIQLENEKLYKKLTKYKDYKVKLEAELQERQAQADRRKRSGPVSYINQLHQSGITEKSSRSGVSDKSSRAHREKENDPSSLRQKYR
jgi:chromosome segregation ATPase